MKSSPTQNKTKVQTALDLLEHFPSPEEISDFAGKFLRGWGMSSCEFLGLAGKAPLHLPVERMLYFSGDLTGFLVLRASDGLEEALRAKKPGPGEDRFADLTHRFFEQFAASYWKGLEGRLVSLPPRPSDPGHWPEAPARAAFGLLVEDVILEVRFWAGTSPDHLGEKK